MFLLIVVCEWVGDVSFVDVLLLIGCCVGGFLCCLCFCFSFYCCELSGCVNGASPVGCVLSFFICLHFR